MHPNDAITQTEQIGDSPAMPQNMPALPSRTTDTVPILNSSRFNIFTRHWQVHPPLDSLTVVVKGTFDIDTGAVSMCHHQEFPDGDVRHEPDNELSSLRYPSDFAVYKPSTDILVVGHAYPAENSAAGLVSLKVGNLHRELAVVGDRTWNDRGKPSEPKPFESMPLRWERALGGPLSQKNPVGRGYHTGVMLPNLERPEALIRTASDAPDPCCFAPVAAEWPSRKEKLGSYGGSYLKQRWPYFPENFDWTYFNAAPTDLRVPFLTGKEHFSISGVTPNGTKLRGTLPIVRPAVFVQCITQAGGRFFELPMRIDTVWFDTDARKVVIIFRGLLQVRGSDASDLSALYVMAVGDNIPIEQAQSRFLTDAAAARWIALPKTAAVSTRPQNKSARPSIPAPRTVERDDVVRMIEKGQSMAGIDLTGIDLHELDLSDVDMSKAILCKANVVGCKFDRANLEGANLSEANAENAAFTGAKLTLADFTKARMAKVSMLGADLGRATLAGAHCDGADFTGAQMDRCNCNGANLSGAIFDGATATNSNFIDCCLDGASFRASKLNGAKLLGCSGDGVAFDGADLTDVGAVGAVLPKASFAGIIGGGSVWQRADLHDSVFSKAALQKANFERADLSGCVFNKADATEALFSKANCRGAQMLKTNLMRAVFESANLAGANLGGANLHGVHTWKACLTGAQWPLAIVTETNLDPM